MSNTAQRSFRTGEVSPAHHARTDLAAYATGLRTARNVVVMPMGGVESRSGLEYRGTTKASAAARLVPCVFASDQAYVLEMGAGYFRFWLAGSLVTFSAPAAWVTSTAYIAGDLRSNGGTNYVCILAHTSGASTEPGVGGSWATYWYAQTGVILELPNPYGASDLDAVQWADASATTRFFAHPSYPLRELIRLGATAWSFGVVTFSGADALTAPTNLVVTGAVGSDAEFTRYRVTAVAGLLESLPSNDDGWNKRPGPYSSGNQTPITLTWDAVSGATAYRIYTSWSYQPWQFKVEVTATTYLDDFAGSGFYGQPPPLEDNAVGDFDEATKYPGVVGIFQQRLMLSGQTGTPDAVYGSRSGSFRNFFPHVPIQDDDALSWKQVGSRVNRVLHLAEADGRLVVFSEVAEGVAMGDSDTIIRPGEINPRTFSFNGSASIPPLNINERLLFVQARQGLVRDLLPTEYASTNLSLTATHLTRGYTIDAWCYQQTPHSTIWMVRSDGEVLSLTYQPETGVVGWAHHDTDGTVESVACIAESGRDTVYAIIARTIDGGAVRYVERMTNRTPLNMATVVCVDAAITVTYSRPHSTLTLSAGSYAGGVHTFTATGSGGSGSFTSADVGRTGCVSKAGTVYRFTISAYTSATIVTVQFTIANGILADSDAFTTGLWWYTSAIGLAYLEGESVSVRLDGVVDASPNNAAYTAVTVTDGIANFNQTTAYASAIIGLPFTVDVETLDLDATETSVRGKPFRVNAIGAWLEESGPFYAGNRAPSTDAIDTDLLGIVRLTDEDETVIATDTVFSGFTRNAIPAKWTKGGRIFLRQVDPVPLTVLALVPIFDSPERE